MRQALVVSFSSALLNYQVVQQQLMTRCSTRGMVVFLAIIIKDGWCDQQGLCPPALYLSGSRGGVIFLES